MLLNELFDFLPKSKRSASYGKPKGNYPFFTSSNTIDKYVDDPDYSGSYLIIGDGGTGNCKYYEGKFSASDHNYIMKPKNGTNPRCVQYFLEKDNFQILNDGFKGIGIKNVSKSYIENIDYKFNKNYTEDYICSTLSRIENLISKEETNIQLLDELIKSRFIELFENQNFSLCAIGEISSFCSRGKSPNYVENSNLLVINQACIYWDELKIENVKYNEDTYEGDRILMRNDILINSTGTGTLGRCNVFNVDDGNRYMADSHVTILRLLGQINPIYFKYWFKSEKTQSCIYSDCVNGSTNQIELSREKLRKVEIPLPPIELQNEFASFVEKVDKLKFNVQKRIEKYKELLNKKMDEYFN